MSIALLSRSKKTLIRALHRRKGRLEEGCFLAEGERLLTELAKSSAGLRFLFGTGDRIEWLAERFPDAEHYVIDDGDLSLFATEQTQGVGAVVDIPPETSLNDLVSTGRPIIYLDTIADPGNAGTIVRTAEWFGIDAAFGSGSVDPFNPKTVRATMGAIFHMSIAAASPEELIPLDLPVIALDAGGSEMLGDASLPRHAVYVVGSEAHGISPLIRDRARLVAIGGAGRVESLNAAVAAGIVLHEISRSSSSPTSQAASRSDRS